MIVMGLIVLLNGLLAKITIVWTVEIIVLIVRSILLVLGTGGRLVGGRQHYHHRAVFAP